MQLFTLTHARRQMLEHVTKKLGLTNFEPQKFAAAVKKITNPDTLDFLGQSATVLLALGLYDEAKDLAMAIKPHAVTDPKLLGVFKENGKIIAPLDQPSSPPRLALAHHLITMVSITQAEQNNFLQAVMVATQAPFASLFDLHESSWVCQNFHYGKKFHIHGQTHPGESALSLLLRLTAQLNHDIAMNQGVINDRHHRQKSALDQIWKQCQPFIKHHKSTAHDCPVAAGLRLDPVFVHGPKGPLPPVHDPLRRTAPMINWLAQHDGLKKDPQTCSAIYATALSLPGVIDKTVELWEKIKSLGWMPAQNPSAPAKFSPFAIAIDDGDQRAVQWLLDHGLSPAWIDPLSKDNVVHMAFHQKNQHSVKALLTIPPALLSAVINQPNTKGDPALHVCVHAMNPKAVEFALQAGADPNAKNAKGQTALEAARNVTGAKAQDQLHRIAQLLEEAGAQSLASSPSDLLLQACRSLNKDLAQKCIEELGADPSQVDSKKKNALILACSSVNSMFTPNRAAHAKKGQEDLVTYLLTQSVDLNAQDKLGNTALHYLVSSGNAHLAQLLLQAGADPYIKNKDEQMPMHMPLTYERSFKQIYIDLALAFLENDVDLDRHNGEKIPPGFEQLRKNAAVTQLIKAKQSQKDLRNALRDIGESTTLGPSPKRKLKM